jgi:hypothetical protein
MTHNGRRDRHEGTPFLPPAGTATCGGVMVRGLNSGGGTRSPVYYLASAGLASTRQPPQPLGEIDPLAGAALVLDPESSPAASAWNGAGGRWLLWPLRVVLPARAGRREHPSDNRRRHMAAAQPECVYRCRTPGHIQHVGRSTKQRKMVCKRNQCVDRGGGGPMTRTPVADATISRCGHVSSSRPGPVSLPPVSCSGPGCRGRVRRSLCPYIRFTCACPCSIPQYL